MRIRWRKSGKRNQKQQAFSLIESVIAAGILGVIGIVILSAIDTNTKTTGIVDEKVTATSVATSCIEVIRTANFTSNFATEIQNTVNIPSHYGVEIITECSTDGETFVSCTGGETLKRVRIIVLHDEKPVMSMCTFKSDF